MYTNSSNKYQQNNGEQFKLCRAVCVCVEWNGGSRCASTATTASATATAYLAGESSLVSGGRGES